MSDTTRKLMLNLDSSNLWSSNVIQLMNSQQERLNEILKPSIFESLIEQQNKITNSFGQSALDTIIKQQEQFTNIFNTSAIDILTKQQESLINAASFSSINAITKQFSSLHNISGLSAFDSIIKKHEKYSSLLNSSLLNSINLAPNILTNLTTISSIAESFQRDALFPDIVKKMEESFSYNLLHELKQENVTLEETIEIAQESFAKQINNIPRSLISFEGMVQLLFAIMLFIHAQTSSQESEENITRKIEVLENNLMAQMSKLISEDEAAVYYVVKRIVHLRTDHTTKSFIIGKLYPNQRVELIERNSKWIYVKYFDYVDGLPKMGWVYKKNLKMQK